MYAFQANFHFADLEMVLADVDQEGTQQADAYDYPLQNRPQLPASTASTEESKYSTDGHESTLPSPSNAHSKVSQAKQVQSHCDFNHH